MNADSALRDARELPFWLDQPDWRRPPSEPLLGTDRCDLVVIGGGYAGLWTALLAKERDPGIDVVLLEAHQIGWAASGRNGGFCAASLTHGLANGVQRFPAEIERLEQLGRANLDAIESAVHRYAIDCDWQRTGELTVATQPWQVDELAGTRALAARHGTELRLLDRDEVRAEVDSPTYLAGLADPDGVALVDPARLARGLQNACQALGVRIHEGTRADRIERDGAGMRIVTATGVLRAGKVALCAGVFGPLLKRLRWYLAPVYDHALVTEPLTADRLAAIGWARRQGMSDAGNQFHYYRLTADDRILWGGYDAIYHYGNRIAPDLEQRDRTRRQLARNFFVTFPQLAGIRFTHTWGGVIDTCTRFSPFFGRACGGRVAYSAGYTGLGVGATRFGAQVMLGLLYGRDLELTSLEMVRRKPVPFPPEPFRYAGIQLTRWSLGRADRGGGQRNLWLRTLDRLGVGFDS
ncbi:MULTISPECIES: NAD(P)/FAD-dependent oxidoreductase [Amycolatopsis]|uniref:NAD(P)/FAD-dependent oxidoreductase n=1 Tax=Amycolatopsis TaxID=1813 RepID=UPI000B8A9BE0|nr:MULTISPECIES: FAD-dependent oxidoreductase [Amycolatopsis]OXM72899.1 FAD-dependent oxidoreductase [Amycolatopsis sp. KNN50.9b]